MAGLRGVYTALVTPFGRTGSLRLRHLPALLQFQREAGVDGVVIAGTNGEGVSLSVNERKRLLEAALAHASDLKVIAGTGACALPDAVVLTRHATRCGAAAVLVLPPFYFKDVSAAGLAAYYRAVLAASGVPVILYSIPQFSGVPIGEALLTLLAKRPRLLGVKASEPDREPAFNLLTAYPHLSVYVGNDLYLSELLQAGAAGVISGTANAFPELVVAVANAVKWGQDPASAQERLNAAIRILNTYPIVGAAKSVLEARGVARLGVRPPLVMPSAPARRRMLKELAAAGLLANNRG